MTYRLKSFTSSIAALHRSYRTSAHPNYFHLQPPTDLVIAFAALELFSEPAAELFKGD